MEKKYRLLSDDDGASSQSGGLELDMHSSHSFIYRNRLFLAFSCILLPSLTLNALAWSHYRTHELDLGSFYIRKHSYCIAACLQPGIKANIASCHKLRYSGRLQVIHRLLARN